MRNAMLICREFSAILWLVLFLLAPMTVQAQVPVTGTLSVDQQAKLKEDVQSLRRNLASIGYGHSEVLDAELFAKGIEWALRYDHDFTPADIALITRSLSRCGERTAAVKARNAAWQTRKGKVALAYRSKIDGSVQPYGVIIPKGYDPRQPIRLDVVLHGSTRPVGLSELRFVSRFDEGDAESTSPPDQAFIELHPLGRVENCYRWAGETDVFEAIEDVCRRYKIDRDRIVLRGMSMGASGTWHLGLKHPDRFVALGPYCGYVDTHRFSETPLPNFVKVGPLPDHQELGLHMLDSVDYAANARMVPAIACMGEKDVFFDAHVIMGQAMEREGLKMVNLISPGTGHVIDPVTHAEQMKRIGEYANKGLDHAPRDLRFVTWTLKYNHCHWLRLWGLERHYARAEVQAQVHDNTLEFQQLSNITRLSFDLSRLPAVKKLKVAGSDHDITDSQRLAGTLVLSKQDTGWELGTLADVPTTGKRPGLQGPIDDAFTTPFLCVRGTGQAWNPAVQAYADASLKRFGHEWQHYMRGEMPVKLDIDLTDEDIRTRNLILFGDPGSNSWIARVLPALPIQWSRETVKLGSDSYPAAEHLPALIAPNPISPDRSRYVVLNSGHTFREAEFAKLNYLLFPRWGDWAVLKIDPQHLESETVLKAGYFNEAWRVP